VKLRLKSLVKKAIDDGGCVVIGRSFSCGAWLLFKPPVVNVFSRKSCHKVYSAIMLGAFIMDNIFILVSILFTVAAIWSILSLIAPLLKKEEVSKTVFVPFYSAASTNTIHTRRVLKKDVSIAVDKRGRRQYRRNGKLIKHSDAFI
jgi:hypothetical protein